MNLQFASKELTIRLTIPKQFQKKKKKKLLIYTTFSQCCGHLRLQRNNARSVEPRAGRSVHGAREHQQTRMLCPFASSAARIPTKRNSPLSHNAYEQRLQNQGKSLAESSRATVFLVKVFNRLRNRLRLNRVINTFALTV